MTYPEPNVQKQVADAKKNYILGIISKKEYQDILDRISYNYDLWLKENK